MSSAPVISSPAQHKYEALEGVRGIAALAVVFLHLPKWNAFLFNPLIDNCYLMVELFFVLSGFVMFQAYFERLNSGQDFAKFVFLRFWRLYPVHFLFLTVFALIEFGKYFAAAHWGLAPFNSASAFETNSLGAFVKNALLLVTIIPYQPTTFNYPSWSISAEFYTYIVYAVIVLAMHKRSLWVFAGISLVSILLIATRQTYGFNWMLRCFAGFFIGVLTAYFLRDAKWRMPRYSTVVITVIIILFLRFKPPGETDLFIFPLAAALIASLVLGSGSTHPILTSRAVTHLGLISYSLYMCHATIIWLANQLIRLLMKRPEAVGINAQSAPQLNQWETLIAMACTVGLALILARLTFKYVESPSRLKSREWAQNRWPERRSRPTQVVAS